MVFAQTKNLVSARTKRAVAAAALCNNTPGTGCWQRRKKHQQPRRRLRNSANHLGQVDLIYPELRGAMMSAICRNPRVWVHWHGNSKTNLNEAGLEASQVEAVLTCAAVARRMSLQVAYSSLAIRTRGMPIAARSNGEQPRPRGGFGSRRGA